nr:MAG: hypothetical protein [Bacteriophage sp.]
MEKEVIQVEIPAGKKAAWVDGFLKLVDAEEEQKKDERPITERVKTFEDACKELGEDHKLVQQFKAIQEAIAEDKEATAYFKLGIITAALNEGWEPDFTNDDEYRYYLCLWTKEELEDKDEAWKDDHNLLLWLGGGRSNYGAYCGLASASSSGAWSSAYAGISARLAHKTEELAIYSGKQFTELWANYATGKEVTSWRNS